MTKWQSNSTASPRTGPNSCPRPLRCGSSGAGTAATSIMMDQTLVVLLQAIREHFGKPMTITSGYRTAAHNTAVGGAKSSQHLLGRAADIQVAGVSVEDVAAYAESLMPDRGGVGTLPRQGGPRRRLGARGYPAQQEPVGGRSSHGTPL